jgi:iron complex outermembrane receptor protein
MQLFWPPRLNRSAWIGLSLLFASNAFADVIDQEAEIEDSPETIIVTARHRQEEIQTVPIPISTVSGKTLEQLNDYDPTSIQQFLPSTAVQSMSGRNTNFSIRGLGNNAINEGLDTSVGLYLDGVYLGRPGMAMVPMVDLAQIEELRGPQGTLFGKNTTAGVISFVTRKPVFSNEVMLSYSGGSRDYMIAQGVANTVLSESTATRLTAYATHDNGWLQNLNGGRPLDGNNNQGFRGQLLAVPDGGFNLRLSVDYNQQDSTLGTPVPYGNNGPGSTFYQRATAAGATNLITNANNYQVNINSPTQMRIRQGGVSAEANWLFDSGHKVTSITAGRYWNSSPSGDTDLTNVSLLYNQGYDTNDSQWSQELRVTSPESKTLTYVAGLYWLTQQVNINSYVTSGSNYTAFFLGNNAFPPPIRNSFSNVTTQSNSAGTTNSYAVYGQAVYHATDKLALSAGLRGTLEQKWGNSYRNAPSGGTVYTNQPGAMGAWGSGVMTLNNFAPTTLLNAAYQMLPNIMGYTSYTYGEKSGGFNLNGVGSGPTLGASSLQVNPERTNDFELGLKTDWYEKRVIANLNLFLTQVNGYQATSVIIPSGSTTPASVITNAGGVRSQGVEFDFMGKPTNPLSLRLNGSYNDVYYTSFQNGVCGAEMTASAGGTCDLTGKPVNGAAKWIINTGGEYKFPLQNRLEPYGLGNYSWRSWSYGDISDSSYSVIPSYGILDMALGLRVPTGSQKWDASVWVKNATNAHYWSMTYQQTIMNTNNPYVGAAAAPRTIGATLKVNFY